MSDRVAVMMGGELLQVAPPRRALRRPADAARRRVRRQPQDQRPARRPCAPTAASTCPAAGSPSAAASPAAPPFPSASARSMALSSCDRRPTASVARSAIVENLGCRPLRARRSRRGGPHHRQRARRRSSMPFRAGATVILRRGPTARCVFDARARRGCDHARACALADRRHDAPVGPARAEAVAACVLERAGPASACWCCCSWPDARGDRAVASPTGSSARRRLRWIGLDNYAEIFADRVFWQLARQHAALCRRRRAGLGRVWASARRC